MNKHTTHELAEELRNQALTNLTQVARLVTGHTVCECGNTSKAIQQLSELRKYIENADFESLLQVD